MRFNFAIKGLMGPEHRSISVLDRTMQSSLSLAAWSLTFRRNVVLPISRVKETKKMISQETRILTNTAVLTSRCSHGLHYVRVQDN